MHKSLILFLILLINPLISVLAQDPSPWPAIRIERIKTLLPAALKTTGVDAWLVICRENNNDPLADHVGCENAGGTASFLFYHDKTGFHSLAFSPSSESTALDELDIHDTVISVDRSKSTMAEAATFIKEKGFKTLAINSSDTNAQADGLSYTQRKTLEGYLGTDFKGRLVSSEQVVYEWLSIKLPAEVEIMRKAAVLTAALQIEAYKHVIPGKTTDADVAAFLKKRMRELGVTDAWAPDQNPNVNSGPDRGHSHSTNKVIMPGDVIQTDFGIRVHDRWVTDIQRFAYVLQPGETKAPNHIQYAWESGRNGGFAAFKAMKPGVKGIEVDAAQSVMMKKAGSGYVPWSTGHPVGYVAHDTGPNLGGSRTKSVRPAAHKKLKVGMVFAFDGFHSWKRKDGTYKTISVEEMVVIKEKGAEYLIPPQQDIILIPSD
ncbi:M24 family metallopeptidase [Temperatibacter marinus]|uniref:M24 family metallopeptidase n=1 Tax=Temperatibacter marinus TaxID=1456591 RepID=A0AA52EK75_9PROT|nr:M24 family metallopeptidase [Temperatibacter marinus]WND04009.1 M24 family metallopeptidase [Temperatibacter marinus]